MDKYHNIQHHKIKLINSLFSILVLLSLASTSYAEKVPMPGELVLQFTSESKPLEHQAFIENYGLKVIEKNKPNQFRVKIKQGIEEPWKQVLQNHPLMQKVIRRTIDIPNTKHIQTRQLELPKLKIQTQQDGKTLQNKVLKYLEQYALDNQGKFKLLNKQGSLLELQISEMRGKVISHRNFWENLNLTVILIPAMGSLEIIFISEIEYASGMGQRAPASTAYLSLEKENPAELDSYSKQLLSALQIHLEKQP